MHWPTTSAPRSERRHRRLVVVLEIVVVLVVFVVLEVDVAELEVVDACAAPSSGDVVGDRVGRRTAARPTSAGRTAARRRRPRCPGRRRGDLIARVGSDRRRHRLASSTSTGSGLISSAPTPDRAGIPPRGLARTAADRCGGCEESRSARLRVPRDAPRSRLPHRSEVPRRRSSWTPASLVLDVWGDAVAGHRPGGRHERRHGPRRVRRWPDRRRCRRVGVVVVMGVTIGISPVSSATVTESVLPRRRRRLPPTGGAPIVPFFASNSATEIGRVCCGCLLVLSSCVASGLG